MTLTPRVRKALDHITADSLRGHLSFIASDALAGRDTPSPGLDIAAEYIAAQFRRAGLEAVGDDGYFQTANWSMRRRSDDAFAASIVQGERTIGFTTAQVSISTQEVFDFKGAAIIKIPHDDQELIDSLTADDLAGKTVLTDVPNFRSVRTEDRRGAFMSLQRFSRAMRQRKVSLVLALDAIASSGAGLGRGRLVDPESPSVGRGFQMSPPIIWLHGPEIVGFYDLLEAGPTRALLNLKLAEPSDSPVPLRNVIGLLRGSDPELRDTYILVTAHYDHVGTGAAVDGDNIYNGANDDGSGTVAIIEIAAALGTLSPRPRRSIVFMAVFGEEKGLLGSRHYVSAPVFPLDKTIANVNLEQIGRTDSPDGPQIARASFTGFDYSDLPDVFQRAGEVVGVEVYNHQANSEAYFARSDNIAFAMVGIPAHTLCVAYTYPDYHGLGDHWDKIDYDNMALISRMTALGLIRLADSAVAPRWNADNPRTAPYLEAYDELYEK